MIKKLLLSHLLLISFNIFSDEFIEKSNHLFNELIDRVESMQKDWNKWHEKIHDSENKLLVDWNQVLLCYCKLPFRVDLDELYYYIFFIEENFIDFDQDNSKKNIKDNLYILQEKIDHFEKNLNVLKKITLESLNRPQS